MVDLFLFGKTNKQTNKQLNKNPTIAKPLLKSAIRIEKQMLLCIVACNAILSARTSTACFDSVGLHVPWPSLDNWLVCCHETTISLLLLICPEAPDSPFPSVAPSSVVHRLTPIFPPPSLYGPHRFHY